MIKRVLFLLKNQKINTVLCIAWLLTSFYLFFSPNEELPGITHINDKLGHFILFASIALLMSFRKLSIAYILVILIAYAISVEIIQSALPLSFKRGAETLDVISDAIGAILGLSIQGILQKTLMNR